MEKIMILVIDGCAPEYLTPDAAPNIYRLAKKYGFIKTVKGAVPTVTNVNHACILSGQFPEQTKVVGNYYYRRDTKEEGFIEEKGFMKSSTIFHIYREAGQKTALLTVKGKVLGVYQDGVDIGISAQTPDPALLCRLGLPAPPAINDLACSRWIMEAALACIKKENPGIVYCTTNDFGFHHHAPETPEALRQIQWIDSYIDKIHSADPDRQIYITADHGMNAKHTLINMKHIAARHKIPLFCLAPLKDRYIENHIYQEGGILYLFLEHKRDSERLLSLLHSIPEIEAVLDNEEAARRFHLPKESIGDYVIFAAPDCAFGEIEGESLQTDQVRTHGSLHEQAVPLAAIHPKAPASFYSYSKDIVVPFLTANVSPHTR